MSVYVGGDKRSRKQRKDAGKERRFIVYIRAASGRKTRGRYYNRQQSAFARAEHLSQQITRKHQVIVYLINKKLEMKVIRGLWPADTNTYIKCLPFAGKGENKA